MLYRPDSGSHRGNECYIDLIVSVTEAMNAI